MGDTILTDAEITQIRAEYAALMPSRASISRQSISSNGLGGQTVSEAVIASNVACEVIASAGSYKQLADKLAIVQPFTVRFPVGTDVKIGDLVTVAGRTFKIEATPSGPITRQLKIQVLASEVE